MPENDPAATQRSGRGYLGYFVAFVLIALAAISLLLSLCGGQGMTNHNGLTDSGLFMIACVVLVILALFVVWNTLTKGPK